MEGRGGFRRARSVDEDHGEGIGGVDDADVGVATMAGRRWDDSMKI